MRKTLTTITLSLVLTGINATWALADDTSWECKGTAYDPYLCTAQWGYVGHDNYNLEQWSENSDYNNQHGCTSFAGYMLWMFNVHTSGIYHFDSAQYWDNEAPTLGNATVGFVPHVGDIAQWESTSVGPVGHVAWVKEVTRNASGVLESILIVDDNRGLGYTTQRRIKVGSQSLILSWPDHFLTFPVAPNGPGSGNGGGTVSVVALSATFTG